MIGLLFRKTANYIVSRLHFNAFYFNDNFKDVYCISDIAYIIGCILKYDVTDVM